jgi:hypothetical protein
MNIMWMSELQLIQSRPARAISRDCRACARNFCQEPSPINTSCKPQIDDASVKCLVCSAQTSSHERIPAAHTLDSQAQPVYFTAHRQPLCWNFLYHSWIILSVGSVVCPKPLIQHHNWLRFGKFQDTEHCLISCPRHVSLQLPPSGETVHHGACYPNELGEIIYLLICSFLLSLSWLLCC